MFAVFHSLPYHLKAMVLWRINIRNLLCVVRTHWVSANLTRDSEWSNHSFRISLQRANKRLGRIFSFVFMWEKIDEDFFVSKKSKCKILRSSEFSKWTNKVMYESWIDLNLNCFKIVKGISGIFQNFIDHFINVDFFIRTDAVELING